MPTAAPLTTTTSSATCLAFANTGAHANACLSKRQVSKRHNASSAAFLTAKKCGPNGDGSAQFLCEPLAIIGKNSKFQHPTSSSGCRGVAPVENSKIEEPPGISV